MNYIRPGLGSLNVYLTVTTSLATPSLWKGWDLGWDGREWDPGEGGRGGPTSLNVTFSSANQTNHFLFWLFVHHFFFIFKLYPLLKRGCCWHIVHADLQTFAQALIFFQSVFIKAEAMNSVTWFWFGSLVSNSVKGTDHSFFTLQQFSYLSLNPNLCLAWQAEITFGLFTFFAPWPNWANLIIIISKTFVQSESLVVWHVHIGCGKDVQRMSIYSAKISSEGNQRW